METTSARRTEAAHAVLPLEPRIRGPLDRGHNREVRPWPRVVCEAMENGGSIQPFRQKERGRERGGGSGLRPGGSVRLPSACPLRHADRAPFGAQVETFIRACMHPGSPGVSFLTNSTSRSTALRPFWNFTYDPIYSSGLAAASTYAGSYCVHPLPRSGLPMSLDRTTVNRSPVLSRPGGRS
jgi:hypothetical protein